MIRAEWLLNTMSGPAVGEATTEDVEGATTAIMNALRDIAGRDADNPEHVEARARVAALIRTTAPAELNTSGRWSHYSPAVALTLSRVNEPG